jgi:GNAT superfamily N-acetyltransferase
MVDVRPMRSGDVADAYAIAMRAFEMEPPAARSERQRRDRRWHARLDHLLETDPGGAWFAESDAGPAGAAMALVRDGHLWGLSLLVVDPAAQSRGTGALLLERTLAYGDGAPAGIVVASTDPRALRVYARAGFSLLPTLSAAGTVDRSALPDRDTAVREAGPEWLEHAGELSRLVRGATHAPDMAVSLTVGERLLHLGERGFVMHDRGSVRLLVARDEAAATALLWSALAESDASVPAEVNWMTAGQDWAMAVAVRAGLELRVTGPLCVRGPLGPLRPYLPSGAYL